MLSFLSRKKISKVSLIFSVLTLLLSLGLSIAEAKWEQGSHLFLEDSDQEYQILTTLLDPSQIQEASQLNFVSNAKRVLILGDGFQKKWIQRAELMQKFFSPSIEIFKTDIDCPAELEGKTNQNIYYKKVDHTRLFPFENDTFDITLMPFGICICKCTTTSCGGIHFGLFQKLNDIFQESKVSKKQKVADLALFQFMSEVVRTLNSNNPNSLAFLHGPENRKKYPELEPYESVRYEALLNTIPVLEQIYTRFEIRLVFFKSKSSDTFEFQGIMIRTAKKQSLQSLKDRRIQRTC